MITVDTFKQARAILSDILLDTRLIYSKHFTAVSGNRVYLKPENLQATGAFKVRGAFYKVSRLAPEQKARGLITASAGNHAQGVAYAARAAGVSATIVMPTTTPLAKVNNTKEYGAEVMLHGGCYDEACAYALQLADEKGLTFIHPFNDLDIAIGQGTIAYEIFMDLPDVDVVLVPIGGDGLAAGVAILCKLLKPGMKVYGVEPAGAACAAKSIEAGEPVTLPEAITIADGVAVRTPGDVLLPYLAKNLDGIIQIEDDELVDSFLDMCEKHKMIVENAGLLTVAALSHLSERDKNVVSILSGGNMDVITIASLVQHGLISRGRVFTFSVQLPDRPGELLAVAKVVSEHNGNIIKLEHNQFVSINRQSAVELRVTLEAFGHEHKERIIQALNRAGFDARVIDPTKI